MQFFLGTHQVEWLWRLSVPLFVSDVRLRRRRQLGGRDHPWALDSGDFSELSTHGRWREGPQPYAERARRYQNEIGSLVFAAPQDWMCEPQILSMTGATVSLHQQRTIDSWLTLRDLAPEVPWAPILQGWAVDDYLRHVDAYLTRGIDLWRQPVVGVGTVCRRQGTREGITIMRRLAGIHLPLHGFGIKITGLAQVGQLLKSADSMAWSYDARRADPLPECTHKNCANCEKWALRWRQRLLTRMQPAF